MIKPRNLISTASNIHLTGIKGVAMTSLAQCLIDLGKTVSGSDVAEHFVTQNLLDSLKIPVSTDFSPENIPANTNLLIYTAAHQGSQNPQAQWATQHNIPVMSHAEALGDLLSQKQVVAVCGVGGKSTTSAMISWGFFSLNQPLSFSVGVGNIPGINRTGRFDQASQWFVTEADEYAVDPSDKTNFQPRFAYLQPQVIVCTSLAFDHPDVYRDYEHTKQVFLQFFGSLKDQGVLIINGDQADLVQLSQQVQSQRPDVKILMYGEKPNANFTTNLISFLQSGPTSQSQIFSNNQQLNLTLHVPGKHNALNACAAITAWTATGLDVTSATDSLKNFRSTMRRFEYIGQKQGVTYYDDYAHHPRELAAILETIKQMYPESRILPIFQPHTFSRTKALFDEFAQVLSQPQELILLDIFASARESADPTISSQLLADKIKQLNPNALVQVVSTVKSTVDVLKSTLHPGDVCITLGAGDVYKIHEQIH